MTKYIFMDMNVISGWTFFCISHYRIKEWLGLERTLRSSSSNPQSWSSCNLLNICIGSLICCSAKPYLFWANCCACSQGDAVRLQLSLTHSKAVVHDAGSAYLLCSCVPSVVPSHQLLRQTAWWTTRTTLSELLLQANASWMLSAARAVLWTA